MQLHDCCSESDLVTCLGSSTRGWAVCANDIARCHGSPCKQRTTRTAHTHPKMQWEELHVQFLGLWHSSSRHPMRVYTITAPSPTDRREIQRRGYFPKIMANVQPSWVFWAQSFLLQKCLLLHTAAVALIGISKSGSWPWGMDRLAHGNMIKGFGEEMHSGGGGKIK